MTRILKRPRAKADLAEIWGYIAEDSEDRADAFIDVIDKKLSMLAENPCLGKARHELGEGVRRFALADQGADTRLIQDYLGHRNIQHTVRYTATNPARFEKLWR